MFVVCVACHSIEHSIHYYFCWSSSSSLSSSSIDFSIQNNSKCEVMTAWPKRKSIESPKMSNFDEIEKNVYVNRFQCGRGNTGIRWIDGTNKYLNKFECEARVTAVLKRKQRQKYSHVELTSSADHCDCELLLRQRWRRRGDEVWMLWERTHERKVFFVLRFCYNFDQLRVDCRFSQTACARHNRVRCEWIEFGISLKTLKNKWGEREWERERDSPALNSYWNFLINCRWLFVFGQDRLVAIAHRPNEIVINQY